MRMAQLQRWDGLVIVVLALGGAVSAAPAATAPPQPRGGTEPSRSAVADAAKAGDLTAVRRLLKDGGDVNAALGDGTTALHHAAMRGDADMVGVLLYAGANVRATTRLGGGGWWRPTSIRYGQRRLMKPPGCGKGRKD